MRRHSGGYFSFRLLAGCILAGVTTLSLRGNAHEVLASAAENARWHAPAKSVTVTFLGKDQKENAVLVLKKAVVLDSEIVILSDASTITLVSGDAIRIPFSVKVDANGTTSRLKLGGGDSATLLFNDKEDPRLRAKWIQSLASPYKNLSIELKDATFATVKFDAAAIEKGAGVADAAAPEPAQPAASPAKAPEGAAHAGSGPELLHNVTPSQLTHASYAFSEGVSHRCPHCSGTGKVNVEVQVGTQRDGNVLRPIMRNQTQNCNVCNGTGKVRATDEALKRLAATFVKSMADVKRDDKDTQEAISASYKMITDVMIGDQRTWLLLTESGKSILSQRAPTPGTPVIVKVNVKRMSHVDGKREYVAAVSGIDQEVRITNPVSADDIESGTALVGGLVAPPAAGDNNVVLNEGFVVAPDVDRAWWWWYGPRPRP
jgi:hypothetical protein